MIDLEVDRITPSRTQPRERFDEEELQALASSIKTAGLLQPVLVRRSGTGFELIAGERRWRAARMAGLRTIPAITQDAGDERSLELALIENIQRQQLNPIEEARAFSSLISTHGLTQEEVAGKLGRSRSSVANTLRLLKLPGGVQDMMRTGALTAGHAKALLGLPPEQIQEAAERMAAGDMTVRAAEELSRGKGREKSPEKEQVLDPNIRDAELRLQRALGTKVRIRGAEKGKGRIEIEFYSAEELERLFDVLEGRTN
ncbi:MAG TPA: ParB/RepB/Spo0J family partition protein [Candidatus Polarisedimenticolia bacterium]|nr:ParB/RepB/Spo0J family partition protein [Candidatus Polarisedimenticolia bacterium]